MGDMLMSLVIDGFFLMALFSSFKFKLFYLHLFLSFLLVGKATIGNRKRSPNTLEEK